MRAKAKPFVMRRDERLPVERLHCGLGQVIDLSRGGMRIACDSKPPVEVGQRGAIKLTCPDGSLPLTGRVVWIRRCGGWRLKKHEIGIEFVAIDEPMRRTVELLAKFGFIDPVSATQGPGDQRWRTTSQNTQKKAQQAVHVDFDLPNYYQILGVEPDADEAEIKKAYRKLARLYHPDVAADGGDAERFTQITEALAVLSDPKRRRSFDKVALAEAKSDEESA